MSHRYKDKNILTNFILEINLSIFIFLLDSVYADINFKMIRLTQVVISCIILISSSEAKAFSVLDRQDVFTRTIRMPNAVSDKVRSF